MKWYSPIFLIPIVVMIILWVGCGFYEYRSLDFRKPASQAVTPTVPTPIHSSSSVPTYSALPSPSPSVENAMSQPSEEWKIYSDNEYHFEVQYPDPNWVLASKVGGPALPYATLKEPKN